MFADLSTGAVGIHGVTLQQTIDLAKQNGFAGIDPPLQELAALPDPAAAAQTLRAAGLRWGGFNLPVEFRKDDATYLTGLEVLKQLAPVAKQIGCTRAFTWIMPGNDELDAPANYALHVQRLKPVAALLAENGVRLGLEFVGPKTLRDRFKHQFLYRIDQMLELADAISPASAAANAMTGVLLDSFHWYTSGATVADIKTLLPNRRIVYVHINDAKPGFAPDQQQDGQRALPGDTGVIDLKGFMGALKAVNYDGPVAAEPFMKELSQQPPADTAARVARAVLKTLSLA
jgi:sugar phosphate isomerase/epimerase